MITLNGRCVQNKGMALFPHKIGNDFVMAARLDGENIYLLGSDNIHFWNESRLLHTPKYPWEFVQVGNCGSPIETEDVTMAELARRIAFILGQAAREPDCKLLK